MISSGTSLEYLFTFTAPMDFTSFDYLDFVILTTDDTTLSITNDFTTAYTLIGTNSFKLTLTPNAMISFSSANFCSATKT